MVEESRLDEHYRKLGQYKQTVKVFRVLTDVLPIVAAFVGVAGVFFIPGVTSELSVLISLITLVAFLSLAGTFIVMEILFSAVKDWAKRKSDQLVQEEIYQGYLEIFGSAFENVTLKT